MNENEQQTDEQYREGLRQQLEAMGPYGRTVSTALVVLGHTIELALNMRDRAVIQEMKAVCLDIFSQAEAALDGEVRNVH